MAARQAEMFDKPKRPHVKRAKIVIDAGHGIVDGKPFGGELECCRCAWQSGWVSFRTVSEMKNGVPCPKCNGSD